MKAAVALLSVFIILLCASSQPAFAAGNDEVSAFTTQTLSFLTILASLVSVVFLIKGGYLYITSTGKPDALDSAKKTIRNALIGLTLVLSSSVLQSLLHNALTAPNALSGPTPLNLTPIQPVPVNNGLTQVLLDAIAGFIQTLVQSATKPLIDGITGFLTSTPSLLTNSVIFNFWLVCLGIVDSLFALLIALLGFQFMSASTFGFEELELKSLLPRVGLAFLGANVSLALADWIILSCNTIVQAVLHATGGIEHSWLLTAFNPTTLVTGTTPLITLIFLALFVILSVVLLLFYISRLILISLGAVIAPFIFLLWALPKFSSFAEVAVKTYMTTIYSVLVQVIVLQLASSFFALPEQNGTNSLISILVGVGLLFTLVKIPSTMMQLVIQTSRAGMVKKIGGQIVNVMMTSRSTETDEMPEYPVKVARRSIV